MAKHWTKIRSDIITSGRMTALLDARGPAYGLYIQAKAVCDDYGRLTAEPRKFKALVAPMSDLPVGDVAAAIELMEELGVVRRYRVDGEPYLEIVAYNEIEETYWLNVGRPEYPAPPDWQPPVSLIEFLKSHRGKPGITAERYGMTEEQADKWAGAPQVQSRCNADEAQVQSRCAAGAEQVQRGHVKDAIDGILSRNSHGNGAGAPQVQSRCAAESETETESKTKGKRPRAQAHATAPPALSEQETTNTTRPTALPATTRILTTIFEDWQPAKLTAWLKAAGRSLQSTAARQVHLDDAALAAELQRTPPTGSSRGDWYVDKLIERLQRTPAARSGAPPEFIALEGECPEEEGGMQIWHYKLEKWLAQREQSAAG